MSFKRGNDRYQTTVKLASRRKGCYLITDEILSHDNLRAEIKATKIGILHLFIQHTSCALSLNENCDPDVRKDMDMALDHVVPESLAWEHVDEGPDDSVSHTKSSIIGVSVTIPISEGRLQLGTWQGVYLLEYRHLAHSRRVVATVM